MSPRYPGVKFESSELDVPGLKIRFHQKGRRFEYTTHQRYVLQAGLVHVSSVRVKCPIVGMEWKFCVGLGIVCVLCRMSLGPFQISLGVVSKRPLIWIS
ncbi:hypothetical protein AVEN_119562-1 [Araneus ventricosus]|uniref:Uncharacterized protein n=1 Tax=Araneus ventricosus TaxID=182803 RepID=A0A4Y2UN46_ARAVE|nr:hypothetical protein AVEN_119562-1 [Araneus ventricosus]